MLESGDAFTSWLFSFVVAVLLICAVATVAQLALGLFRTWSANRSGEEAWQRAEVLTREGKSAEALAVTRRLPGPVSAVIAAGLEARGESAAHLAVESGLDAERTRLMGDVRRLDALALIALLLPVAAAIIVALAGAGPAPPADQASVLLVLALGLGTAILAVLGRFWILARVRRIVVEMEKGAAVVYNTAR